MSGVARRLSRIFSNEPDKQKDAEKKVEFSLTKINRHGTRQNRTLLVSELGISNVKNKVAQWYFPKEDIHGIFKDKTNPCHFEIRVIRRYQFEADRGKDVLQLCDAFSQLYGIKVQDMVPPPAAPVASPSQKISTPRSPSVLRTPSFLPSAKSVSVDSFELIKVLGKGSFSNVVLVRKKDEPGRAYAMKILNKAELKKRNQVEHTLTEREILAKYSHPFIVKLYYSFQTQDKLYMCLEYVSGGELFYHLKRARRFPENLACFYAAEVASALEFLHSHDIVYRDLKPENVLVDSDGHLKLTDFGLSKTGITSVGGSSEGNKTRTFCGTPDYLAPEVILGLPHGKGVDWWGLGVLLYEMLTGQPPFKGQTRNELYDQTLKSDIVFPEFVSPTARSIVLGLLFKKPEQRLGANGSDEVKNHPFFAKINWEKMVKKEIDPPFKPIVTPQDTMAAPTVTREEKELYLPSVSGKASSPSFKDFSFVHDSSLQLLS